MKTLPPLVVLACLLPSCELTNYVPPVTPQMAIASKDRPLDAAMLNQGRALFARRCIECHTLPPLWHYSADDWPQIIDSMAHRASLKRAERQAIVAYIRAVRSQK